MSSMNKKDDICMVSKQFLLYYLACVLLLQVLNSSKPTQAHHSYVLSHKIQAK